MGAITDLLASILTDAPLSAVLRERLALAKDRVANLEQENGRLLEENARLVEQLAACNQRVRELDQAQKAQADRALQEFKEHRGVLFRRQPSGGFEEAVFCPRHHIPMYSPVGSEFHHCPDCGIRAGFAGEDLKRVIQELGD